MFQNSKPKNPYLNEHFQSEMHEQFRNPVIKKPAVTRTKRLEQLLWNEFYEEYIRSKDNSNAIQLKNHSTEYSDEYGKFVKDCKEIDGRDILAKDYPLYADAAITYWNPNRRRQGNFGKILSITLPVSQQHEQIG